MVDMHAVAPGPAYCYYTIFRIGLCLQFFEGLTAKYFFFFLNKTT